MELSSLACPPRWATPRDLSRRTLGGQVANVAAALGTPLMAWQRQVADVAYELDDRGNFVHRTIVVTVPRQSGKTALTLAVMVHRAVMLGSERGQRITYAAQTGKDAREKWEDDHLAQLAKSPFAKHFTARKTNGSEAIKWANGSLHTLMAGTETAGHGKYLDLGVIDEAFAQDGRAEQAMVPAMNTRYQYHPGPQLWVVSTAGIPGKSAWLWDKVERGRGIAESGAPNDMAYFEWSAPDDLDPHDPETWALCSPAMHLFGVEGIRTAHSTMPLPEFERAHLNRWKAGRNDPVISAKQWAACVDARSTAVDPVVFSFDVTPDRSQASIGMAGVRPDGSGHIEVLESGPGTGWVSDRLRLMVARWSPAAVVCDPAGPAGSLMADVRSAGVDVVEMSTRQHALACGSFYDAVLERRLFHHDDQRLDVAVDGAQKRPLGDAWAWSRKSTEVDISPLVAVTLAWGWLRGSLEPDHAGGFVDLDDY